MCSAGFRDREDWLGSHLIAELLDWRPKVDPTPRLWCSLGDATGNPEHYEKAWELSGERYARAMRSLGPPFQKALALEVSDPKWTAGQFSGSTHIRRLRSRGEGSICK